LPRAFSQQLLPGYAPQRGQMCSRCAIRSCCAMFTSSPPSPARTTRPCQRRHHWVRVALDLSVRRRERQQQTAATAPTAGDRHRPGLASWRAWM